VVSESEAVCNLALVLTTEGKLDDAKQAYRQVLEKEPSHKRAREALTKLEAGPPPQRANVGPLNLPGPGHSPSMPPRVNPAAPPSVAPESERIPDLSPIEVPDVGGDKGLTSP
jgi:hypothetical protein